jgi:NADPH:quinone reductase-like Zn-dependent oxidoreductase
MRAAILKAFGNPVEGLEYGEMPEPPPPGAGEVLVRIEFAPVNMNDLVVARGAFAFRPTLPSVIGNEAVGRVVAVGPGVSEIKVGDRVLPPAISLTWRERMVIPAAGLFALPDADPKQLAMLAINPPTAAILLDGYVQLSPGAWVLQNAANSAVGRWVIALAKQRGLRTVNVVRRPELVNELTALGADQVLVEGPDLTKRIHAAVGGTALRLALDGVSGTSTGALANALSPGGTVVTYSAVSGSPMTLNPLDVIFKPVTIAGFFLPHPHHGPRIPAALREAAAQLASGAVKIPIAATYPLSAIKDAVAHVQRGGKVLLDLTKND